MSDEATEGRRHPPFLGRLWQHHGRHAPPSRLEAALFGEQTPAREAALRETNGRTWNDPADALAWLLRATGSQAAAYVHLDLEGQVESVVVPEDLTADRSASLLDRARDLFVSGELGPRVDEEGAAVTWYAGGALRALLAAGARADDARALTRIREFLDAHREHGSGPRSGRPPNGPSDRPPRPRLVEVAQEDHGDMARVTVSLEWRGHSLIGSATGAASEEGRHRAAARAVVRALGPAVTGPLRVDRFRLISSGSARLAVAAVRLDDRVLTGAAAAQPGEATAGARAALAALNRELTRP